MPTEQGPNRNYLFEFPPPLFPPPDEPLPPDLPPLLPEDFEEEPLPPDFLEPDPRDEPLSPRESFSLLFSMILYLLVKK
jgi:hypothetical protein